MYISLYCQNNIYREKLLISSVISFVQIIHIYMCTECLILIASNKYLEKYRKYRKYRKNVSDASCI